MSQTRHAAVSLFCSLLVAAVPACGDDGGPSAEPDAGGPDAGSADAGANTAPLAAGDQTETLQEVPVDIAVLANDSDPDDDLLEIAELSAPANGTAEIGEDGTVRYSPAADFVGEDEFSYTVTDGTATATATVTVEVTLPYTERAGETGTRPLVHHGGRFYRAFSDTSSGDADVYLRTSDDGVTWSEKRLVSDGAPETAQDQPSLVVWDEGEATHVGVIYRDRGGDTPQLRFALSTDRGDSFAASVQVSDHDDNSDIRGSIAVDAAGALYAAWTRRYSGDRWDDTFFSSSSDGGVTWSTPTDIFNGDQYGRDTSIAAAGAGEVCVTSVADIYYKTTIHALCSTDGGATFTDVDVTGHTQTGWIARHQTLTAGADGTYYLVWQDRHGTDESVNLAFSKSTDAGATWSTPVRVSDEVESGSQLSNDRMATSFGIGGDGRLYAVWADPRADFSAPQYADWNYDVYLSLSEDGGATWSEDLLVNDQPELADQAYAIAAVAPGEDSDTVVVGWRDPRLTDADGKPVPRALYRVLTLP